MKLIIKSLRLEASCLLLAVFLLGPAVAAAQEQPTPPPVEEAEEKALSPGNAGSALTDIERLLNVLGEENVAAELGERLDAAAERLNAEVESRLQQVPLDQVDRVTLDGVLRSLTRHRAALDQFEQDLGEAMTATDSVQESLRQTEQSWTELLDGVARDDLPPELANLIGRVVKTASSGRQRASDRLVELVAIETRALELRGRLEALETDAAARERALMADILRRDAKPIWTAFARLSASSIAAEFATVSDNLRFGINDLADAYRNRLLGQGLAGLLVLVLLLTIRRNPALREQIADSAGKRILDHPIAVAFVLTLAFTQPLYPTAQPSVIALNTAVFISAELVVLGAVLQGARPRVLLLLGAFLVTMIAVYLLPFDTPLYRLVMFAGAFGGIAVMVVTWRFVRLRSGLGRLRPAVSLVIFVLGLLLASAVIANIVGAVKYANFVVEAAIRSYLAALGLLTLSIVARDVVDIALNSRLFGLLRSVQQSKASITFLLRKAITALAVIFWLWAALSAFRILDPLSAGVQAALDASWSLGQATISIGTIMVFVFSVWLAVYVSRVTRFFLDEDVLPRLNLPRGVPAAISTGTHYLIISGALLFGTAAAGLDLTKLAIVVGALSVGIGFGLQNIVNNFVSGLILLFERPIQVGDHVQVGQLMGRVSRIGIRASTVRTYEGSEVIVPNGDLISQQVVNNTLSDRDRRLEVLVGVAYGTDLEKARDVIEGAVKAVSEVSEDPAALVLFSGFGDSSLDFRVLFWIDDFDIGLRTKSEVGIAISQALARAGIQIPFPQRDVHLHNAILDGAAAES